MALHKRIRCSRGYTLAELLFVFMAIGVMLALTAPSVSHFLRSNRVVGTANELVADLHYARSMAVSKRKSFHIEFDVTEYRIVETVTGDVVQRRTLPTGIICTASAEPNFYAWGLADPVSINISGGDVASNVALSANGSVTHY